MPRDRAQRRCRDNGSRVPVNPFAAQDRRRLEGLTMQIEGVSCVEIVPHRLRRRDPAEGLEAVIQRLGGAGRQRHRDQAPPPGSASESNASLTKRVLECLAARFRISGVLNAATVITSRRRARNVSRAAARLRRISPRSRRATAPVWRCCLEWLRLARKSGQQVHFSR